MAYEAVEAALRGAEMDPAEAHGLIAGMLCADDSVDCDRCLAALFAVDVPEGELSSPDRATLCGLFEETRRRLVGENFEFDLFLPGDDVALSRRAAALGHWCQGFLYGFGSAASGTDLPGDCGEILRDLAEISKIDVDAEGGEDEEAFMELNEYIRVGVQLIRAELKQKKTKSQMH